VNTDQTTPDPVSYAPSFSMGVVIFYVFPTINLAIKAWGYPTLSLPALLIGVILSLVAIGLASGLDYLFSRLGLSSPVRSGIWLGATLGPMTVLATLNQGGSQLLAQYTGILGIILGFVGGYFFETKVKKQREAQ